MIQSDNAISERAGNSPSWRIKRKSNFHIEPREVRPVYRLRKGKEMGIEVRELLANDFFRDYEVIAGRKGMNKEIQGITVLEAPDGFKWTKGKEMIMSSGYAMMQDPECVARAFAAGNIQKASALMIKTGRYLERIPDEVVALCNEHELPLIIAPFSVPWMEIISQTNVVVMNRTIRKFQVPDEGNAQVTNQSYKEKKIRRILQAVESEMKFPAILHDVVEDKSWYSSSNFKRMSEYYGLNEQDYWEPSIPYTHHMLCDYIKMSRYRLINTDDADGPRISWVIIPISVNGSLQAYFAVMEAHSLLDYYDEFAIRMAYLMIQSLYDQINGARDAGYMGFENFIHFALSSADEDRSKVISQAGIQGISMSELYDYAVIRFPDSGADAARGEMMKSFSQSRCMRAGKLVLLDDRDYLLLLETSEKAPRTEKETRDLIEEFLNKVRELLPERTPVCAVAREGKTLRDIRDCVHKCRRILETGRIILPDESIIDYDRLGPFAWLDIPEDELNRMVGRYSAAAGDERGRELLKTLRIYLENNMNFSVTADAMFVHINTIRKRIDRASEMFGTDWNDPVERMKTSLLLQYLENKY